MGSHQELRSLLAKAGKHFRKEVKSKGETQKPAKLNEDEFMKSCCTSGFAPSPSAQYYMRCRADELLDKGETQQAAAHYTQYQALTFKQQLTQQLNKRKLKTKSDIDRKKKTLDSETKQDIEDTDKQLIGLLDGPHKSVETEMKKIPSDWTVVQISCYGSLKYTRFKSTKKDTPMNDGNPHLALIRLCNDGNGAMVRKVLSSETSDMTPYLLELQNLIKQMTLILKEPVEDLKKYWNLRTELNSRMQTLTKSVEDSWLNSAKTWLLGKLDDTAAQQKVDQVVQEVIDILQVKALDKKNFLELKLMLCGAHHLGFEQIFHEFVSLLPNVDKDNILSASKLVQGYTKNILNFKDERRGPVVLILDTDLQTFPWESLPCVKECRQPMSRLPSLQYLSAMWKVHEESGTSVINSGGVNQDSVFYMINPDKSLPKTQERLEGVMKGYTGWQGISGKPPLPGQLATALSNKDAYIYAGHGSGNNFMPSNELKKLRIRSAPLLFGCRSAELARAGRNLDPLGVAHSYLVASSPALAGFLWPVTDNDLDQWTIKFLDYWMNGKEKSLLQAIADQRSGFKHLVNSAALVVYGFPISIK